jgi:type IV pilus assembly protein PilM
MTDIPVWGVDITATCLRAVKLSLDSSGKVWAEAWDVIDFAEDVDNVHSLGRWDAQKRAIHSFLRHHDIEGCLIFATLRGESAFNRTVTVPQTADTNVDRLLEYEAQQQIPYPLDDVYWDRRVVAIKEDGDVVATIYAVQKSIVTERLGKLEIAGLTVDGLVLRPVALQNFCSREHLLEPGTVVVDVDYAGAQVLLVHEDQTTFRSLAVGGSEVVDRIKTALKVDHVTALRLATGQRAPAPGQESDVARVRKEVAREVGAEVLQAIRAYATTRPNFSATNVVLFETHAAVPPMSEVLKSELKLPVFRARGFHSIEIEPGIVSAGIQDHFAGIARSVGLALQGLGKADVALRLYPKEMPRTFRPKPVGWLVAACLLCAMVVVGYLQRRKLVDDLTAAVEESRVVQSRIAGRSAEALERELAADPLVPIRAKWTTRTAFRSGRAGWYDALVAALQGARGPGGTPLLVHFEWGDVPGRVPSPNLGHLVLAAPEDRPVAELDKLLSDLVNGLVGREGLRSATPGAVWSAGALAQKPPGATDSRVLRHRFRHVAFELLWEGS